MPDPGKYTRDYSFTDYQASNPSAPLPGLQVDAELEDVEASIGGIVDAIKDVRRSDGALKNGIVTVDSLDATVRAGVGAGALASAEAAAASADAASDSAVAAAASATAAAGSATSASGYASDALTSRNEASGFSDDTAAAASLAQTARDYANQWATEAEDTLVDDGVNTPGYSAYHWAQVALDAASGSIDDGSVTTAKLANGVLSVDTTGRAKMADGFVTSAKIADGSVTPEKLAAGVAIPFYATGAALPTSDIGPIWHVYYAAIMVWDGTGYASVNVGESRMFAFDAVPTGYLEENGAAISRTTYAALFRRIGTTWGAGDGSTTFNIPDSRGEFIRGFDNGRGVDSGRSFASAQSSQNLSHNHGVTDPGHRHYSGYGVSSAAGSAARAGPADNIDNPAATSTALTGITINTSGGSEARPRNVTRKLCIKF